MPKMSLESEKLIAKLALLLTQLRSKMSLESKKSIPVFEAIKEEYT